MFEGISHRFHICSINNDAPFNSPFFPIPFQKINLLKYNAQVTRSLSVSAITWFKIINCSSKSADFYAFVHFLNIVSKRNPAFSKFLE